MLLNVYGSGVVKFMFSGLSRGQIGTSEVLGGPSAFNFSGLILKRHRMVPSSSFEYFRVRDLEQ
jgi:hypothetical protein